MMPALKVVSITPLAAQKVKEFIQKEGKESGVLRMYVSGGGCSGLTYGLAVEESANEDDIVVEENGARLVVDAFSLKYLKGTVVDYVENIMGSGFKIENPNVTKSCGCGHSFTTD